jgi:hypothetical protein
VTSVEDLEKRVEALALDLERLRLGAAASPSAPESMHGFGPAASRVYNVPHGVSIGGYGEMVYQNFAGDEDDGTPSAETDSLDLLRAVFYFGYKFNDRFLFNSEIEFEHAVAGDGEPGEVAVEFAYIDFRSSRSFGVRGGVLLVPMGFLNELHEPPIFHGSRRPEVERFIIPSTWRENGFGVYGESGPVSWKLYLVTSLRAENFSATGGIRDGRQEGAEAIAEDLAVTGRVDYGPVPGLLLGASAFTGKTGQGVPGLADSRLTLWDAHAEWNWRGLHLRALYARGILTYADAISLAAGETIGSRQRGYYGEIAWNLLAPLRGTDQEVSPFVRYEDIDTQGGVPPGFTAVPEGDRRVRTYGLTYRPIPNIALKLDLQDFSNVAGTGVDQVNLALGYLF